MEAGDALFFHSNVLHRSDKNDSDRRRWAFLIAYNRTSNNPVYPHHHPQYTKLEKVKHTQSCSIAIFYSMLKTRNASFIFRSYLQLSMFPSLSDYMQADLKPSSYVEANKLLDVTRLLAQLCSDCHTVTGS